MDYVYVYCCTIPGHQQVEYAGKKYHVDCFTCMSCKKPIGDNTFMPYGKDNMCMNCHNAQTGTNCGGCSKVQNHDKRSNTCRN